MPLERRETCYWGRVQGVGFRATVRRLATGFAVTGSVRNQADGSVQVLAFGEPTEVDRFVQAIELEFAPNIRDQTSVSGPATDSVPDAFDIQY